MIPFLTENTFLNVPLDQQVQRPIVSHLCVCDYFLSTYLTVFARNYDCCFIAIYHDKINQDDKLRNHKPR